MSVGTPTRATLLERIQDGADPLAWDDFFERYWPLVFQAAKRRGCAEHTAEEIVQEVMLAVFEKKAVFRHDPARGRFRDWLGGVVRNKVAERRRRRSEQLRARGGENEVEMAAAGDDADAAWESAFDLATLGFLLDVVRREMNPRTYQAFELLVLGELSGADVARMTGLTRNAVYLARRNVLKRLTELGAIYREQGPPDAVLRAAIGARPSGAVERSVATRSRRKPNLGP